MTELNDELPGAVLPANSPGNSLAGVKLFSGFAPDELSHIEQSCTWRKCKAGEEILTPQSSNRDVFFITDGEVRVVNYSLTGREVAYAELKSGDFFGELAAIDGEARSAAVVAHTTCTFAALAPDMFRAVIADHPSVAIALIEKLARIVRICDDRIMDLATLGAHQRVYRELLKLVSEDPVRANSWLIYPMPTQAAIAAKASTTRETVARVMSQLANAGIVERKSKTLYIRDLERLDRLVSNVGEAHETGGR